MEIGSQNSIELLGSECSMTLLVKLKEAWERVLFDSTVDSEKIDRIIMVVKSE